MDPLLGDEGLWRDLKDIVNNLTQLRGTILLTFGSTGPLSKPKYYQTYRLLVGIVRDMINFLEQYIRVLRHGQGLRRGINAELIKVYHQAIAHLDSLPTEFPDLVVIPTYQEIDVSLRSNLARMKMVLSMQVPQAKEDKANMESLLNAQVLKLVPEIIGNANMI
jgi:hypothetical protein